ncbi:TolC family protein [uncultured Bacteroides sp.]|uniref:TolC family protein n=1 Tax=uncultured Bacteroides sp. TaxID=162156 RepID=UPI0025D1AACA|nr:TolC family protein [uncultured Bacteroides sp.]
MKKQIITLVVAALSLSSCGIYTKYKPVTTVPDKLYGTDVTVVDTLVTAGSTGSLADLSWRQLFTDPQLQALIEQGLQNNTDLQSAQWRVEEARASLSAARLAYLPSFALSPQGTVSSFDKGKASQIYSLPVTSNWEIDIFGRLTNAKRRAKALHAQSQEYELAVKTQLIANLANAYYTLLMLDAQLAISKETEVKWKESVRVMQALKNAGQGNEAGLAQTEATYYSICTTVLDLQEQISQVENSLCLMLGETPRSIRRGKLEGQVLPQELSVGIPLQLLANRPDVKAAELALTQAFYSTNEARSAFYPSITLSGSAGWTNGAGEMILNPGKLLLSAVGSLTQPLFNNGQNIARLKIAKAQQEEAKLAFTQSLLNAGAEVNNALKQNQTARDKASFYTKQIASLQTAVSSTRLLMQHGSSTYLEVLTAQQTLLTAELTQVGNRFQEIQSVINLYQALGGGR